MEVRSFGKKIAAAALATLLAMPLQGIGAGEAGASPGPVGYSLAAEAPGEQHRFEEVKDMAWGHTTSKLYLVDAGQQRIAMITQTGMPGGFWRAPDGIDFRPEGVAPLDADRAYVSTGTRIWEISLSESGIGHQLSMPFSRISGIAADRHNEYVYVADRLANAVSAMDTKLGFESWNARRAYMNAEGEPVSIGDPTDVAVDADGNLYVLNNGGTEILLLNFSFELLRKWDSVDGAAYDSIEPGTDGRFYVADSRSGEVSVFDTDGRIGFTNGADGLPLEVPAGIAYFNDRLFVAESDAYRLRQFDSLLNDVSSGLIRNPLVLKDFLHGNYFFPESIAVDPGGNVYVGDTGKHLVHLFDSALNFMTAQGNALDPDGFAPSEIAIAPDGSLLLITGNYLVNADFQSGSFSVVYGLGEDINEALSSPDGLTVDKDGHIYIADSGNDRILKLNSRGELLQEWTGQPNSGGSFWPSSIALDDDADLLYVAGRQNVQTFRLDGSPVSSGWGSFAVGPDESIHSIGNVAVAPNGEVFASAIVDEANGRGQRIFRFAADGSPIESWEVAAPAGGADPIVSGLATDAIGNLFALDRENGRVLKYARQIADSVIAPQTASFDKKTANQADVVATVSLNGNKLLSIRNGSETLAKGTDYEVAGNAVTIKSAYLAAQATGATILTFVFNAGQSQTLEIAVVDTTAPVQPPRPPGGGGGGGGGGAPNGVKPGVADTDEPGVTVKTSVKRGTEADGSKTDTVELDAQSLIELLKQAAEAGKDAVSLAIKDSADDPADGIVAIIPKSGIEAWANSGAALELSAKGILIKLSRETLAKLAEDGKDVEFRIVPILDAEERRSIAERAKKSQAVISAAPRGQAEILGQPYRIESSYAGRSTLVQLPLTGIELPSDRALRDAFLDQLRVYVEHRDGEIELLKGNVVSVGLGRPAALEISVDKFSTFAPIALNEERIYRGYVEPAEDGYFRPADPVTRAELAVWLAGNMGAAADVPSASGFADVPDAHPAASSISRLKREGIMIGDGKGRFRPEAGVTRAELARIIATYKGLNTDADSGAFPDVAGHWATGAISAVWAEGWMIGFQDGTFRPNAVLTRAEAIKALNRLFERPETLEVSASLWKDVPATHWASKAIESATQTFSVNP